MNYPKNYYKKNGELKKIYECKQCNFHTLVKTKHELHINTTKHKDMAVCIEHFENPEYERETYCIHCKQSFEFHSGFLDHELTEKHKYNSSDSVIRFRQLGTYYGNRFKKRSFMDNYLDKLKQLKK